MAYDPNTYDPYRYNGGQTPSGGGVGGALSNESVANATVQSRPPGGDPYSSAIQHTMNWMQYVMPQGAMPQTDWSQAAQGMTKSGPTQLPGQTSQMNSVTAPVTTGGGGGMSGTTQSMFDIPIQQSNQTYQEPSEPIQPPGGQPSPEPVPPPPGGDTGGGGPEPTPPSGWGGGPDQQRAAQRNYLMETYGFDETFANEILDRTASYASNPGYEFLAGSPQLVAEYVSWMQDPNMEQQDFVEWMYRNREHAERMTGMPLEEWIKMKGGDPNRVFQDARERWAQRMRDEGNNQWGAGKADWVEARHVGAYDQWWGQEHAAGRPGLTFWEWAHWVNGQGKLPPGYPGSDEPPTDKPPTDRPVPPPGGGGNVVTRNTPGTPTGDGMDEDHLKRLLASLREQGAAGRDRALRQFRHEAGLSGLNDMGAYNPALGELIQSSLRDENSAIYELMHASSEAERQRALQKYLGELNARTQESVASIGAGASMYGDDLRYRLGLSQQDLDRYMGLAGLDVTREGNYLNYNNDNLRTILAYLQALSGGQNPGSVLGGQPPSGDVIVHN